MPEQQQSSGAARDRDEQVEMPVSGASQISVSGVADLIDEIDSLLEENAESFGTPFVQKRGQ